MPVASPRPSERAEIASPASPTVAVRSVSKSFRLPHQQYSTLKERALHPLRSTTYDELHALRDVSFEVAPGEFLGIVGRNGSGKSTLLKCLAGIYDTDDGEIAIRGRLSPFIELGVGFNPDLTARDNVVINAILLGLTRRQARERFDDIIRFAELEEFVDLKLKNYSSGMSVRLAFAVAVQVDADILLVDEVLAVGDAAFQQKCYEEFQRLKDAGNTILFVTHDMGAVERFSDRAMLIERGQVVEIGEPRAIARAYNELNFGGVVHAAPGDGAGPGARPDAEILAAWFEDAEGEPIPAQTQGVPCRACMEVRFHREVEDPIFAIAMRNLAHHTVFAASTQWTEVRTGTFAAGETVVVRVAFDNWLAPSRYALTPSVARAGAGADALDLREDMAHLIVHGQVTGGVADLPHDFTIDRSGGGRSGP